MDPEQRHPWSVCYSLTTLCVRDGVRPASWGCLQSITGWGLSQPKLLLGVPEASSPRSGCSQGGFLLRTGLSRDPRPTFGGSGDAGLGEASLGFIVTGVLPVCLSVSEFPLLIRTLVTPGGAHCGGVTLMNCIYNDTVS